MSHPTPSRLLTWLARPARRWVLACVCLLPGVVTAQGLNAFQHTAWVVGQGAPGDIWDLAETPDNGLLLATGSGLYRFDGRQFTRQDAPDGARFPSSNMTTLLRDADGTLWIAYYNAGISRLSPDGQLRHYQAAEGLPPGLIPKLERDASGRLWAAADGGLRWFDGERWLPPTAAMGIGDVPAQWALRDAQGTLWLLAGGQLWRLPAHAARFEALGLPVSRLSALALRGDGQLWLADRQHGVMPVADVHGLLPDAQRRAATLPDLRAARLRFARDGSLWGSFIANGGVFRVSFDAGRAPRVERFDAAQGLTSTTAVPLLEDREHNLWVGTNLGLNRFREHDVRALPLPGPADPLRTLYRAPDGSVFGYGEDLQPLALQRDLLSAPMGTWRQAATRFAGSIWLLGPDFVRLRHAAVSADLHPGTPGARDLRAMVSVSADDAWFCYGADRIVHYQKGQWLTDARLPAMACSSLASGPQQQLLMGFPDGHLRVLKAGTWRHYGQAQGLDVGPISSTALIGTRLWVAGENGLALLGPDGYFHSARATTPGLFEGITGIVQDSNGQYWLNGARGLVRIEGNSLATATLEGRAVDPRLFDTIDGMPGIAAQSTPVPSAVLAPDGLLWLSTNQGLAWLDTLHAAPRTPAPQPRISQVSWTNQQRPLRDGDVLPAGTTQLQIDYTAVSLTRPERTRYRYRLIGLDEQWQEAGTLTRAFFTNLPPGSYRFEVMAANQDSVWSEHPAQRAFRIAPIWYQTLWFKALCVLAVLAAIVFAVRLRSRRLTQLVRARLKERHAERERIARELHDTLLQGTQGLILRLHAVSHSEHAHPAVREALETAMQQAEQALAEGRERVSLLRDGSTGDQDLGAALVQVYGERASGTDSPALRLNVEGSPRPLRQDAAEEVYLIGREALLNALQHARADAVEVELAYTRRGLRLHIRDDGAGLPDTLPEGRWGLVGMRERAERLGARLRLWSRAGAGTEVELFLPRDRIYLPRRPWRWRTASGDTA
ncbi:sensor histidine kinase [Stenotrophomonas sp. PS02289]|uniref:sensor histidine kinase n=1 Tax=Stenotrophomonas sp. PS02289 TaxID=2991422 RepID=UPI002499DABA|nr:sensor histidine kinase [Stenotrophomonas sp. PS02289]